MGFLHFFWILREINFAMFETFTLLGHTLTWCASCSAQCGHFGILVASEQPLFARFVAMLIFVKKYFFVADLRRPDFPDFNRKKIKMVTKGPSKACFGALLIISTLIF